MAHNLTLANGKIEMAYYGETPWHGLGTQLAAVMTPTEALAAANLGWTVALEELTLATTGARLPDQRAIVRQDTRVVLGIAKSASYQPLQNQEAMEWLEGLVGEGVATIHTAGSLDEGRQVWALAKLPGALMILPDDAMEQYLLFRWGHDSYHAADVTFTGIRVVCQNTLNMAMPEVTGAEGVQSVKRGTQAQKVLHVKHTKGMTDRLTEGLRVLGVARKYFEALGTQCRAMTTVSLNERMLTEYFAAVCPKPAGTETSPASLKAWDRQQETLAALFHEGRHNILPGVKGTLWGAFNAATEYVDHCVKRRSTDSRMVQLLWGSGAEIKQRAFDRATALIG